MGQGPKKHADFGNTDRRSCVSQVFWMRGRWQNARTLSNFVRYQTCQSQSRLSEKEYLISWTCWRIYTQKINTTYVGQGQKNHADFGNTDRRSCVSQVFGWEEDGKLYLILSDIRKRVFDTLNALKTLCAKNNTD